MKNRILLWVLSICISQYCFSQEPETSLIESENFDEVKINALFLIVGAFDLTYERTLNEESGLGITVFLPFDSEVRDDTKYYISPYYRFYFGKKYAAGLFVEGFGMLNETNRNIDFFFDTNTPSNYVTDFALGFGIGGKWLSKSGFILELSAGFGRNLFNNNDTDYQIIGKGGIILGYRF